MELEAGRVVGQYTVQERIGEGGHAVVYRVVHATLETQHALKVVKQANRTVRTRLVQEGRMQAKLRHPNVVAVTDVVDLDGALGIIMEYVEGPSLDELLASRRLSIAECDTIASGILRGARAAHAQGFVHRDLKPANILIDRLDDAWHAKVADFGLAKALLDEDAVAQGRGRTRTGAMMGTPAFMSPEQVRDTKHVDHRTDVFALGAILHEMCTGERCFTGVDLFEIIKAVAEGARVDPRSLNPELPDRMAMAIHGALVRDLDKRIPDVDTLRAVWSGELAWARMDEAALTTAPPPQPRHREGPHGYRPTLVEPADATQAGYRPTLVEPEGASRAEHRPTLVRPDEPSRSPALSTTDLEDPPPTRGSRWLLPAAGAALAVLLLGGGGWAAMGGLAAVPPENPVASVEAEPLPVEGVVEAPTEEPESPPDEVDPDPPATEPDPPVVRAVATLPPAVRVAPPVEAPVSAEEGSAEVPQTGLGHVVVRGDPPDQIVFVREGRRHPAGPLGAGVYTMMTAFDGRDLEARGSIEVRPGKTVEVTCDAYWKTCK